MVDGSPLNTYEASGTNHLWPDWASLRLINFRAAPNDKRRNNDYYYASVMCSLLESSLRCPDMGSRRCPRTLLQRVLERVKAQHGIAFLVGFETEFIIASRDSEGKLCPGHVNPGRNSVAGIQGPGFRYVEEAVRELQDLGVEVQQFHAEGYHGQYEISTGPLPPMAAVDALVAVRDTVKTVCARYENVIATLHPKPFTSHPASAAHAHISLVGPDTEKEEEHFIAGILRRLPALCAFSMANFDSYRRRTEAGQWVSWGTQSRDVPLRKISRGHWEIRSADATANTYLFLAAYLAAGLLGIRDRERLVWKDSTSWSSDYSAAQREALNIDTAMPSSLIEALDALTEDLHGLDDVLGRDIITQYAYLKERECALVAGWDVEKRVQVYSEFF